MINKSSLLLTTQSKRDVTYTFDGVFRGSYQGEDYYYYGQLSTEYATEYDRENVHGNYNYVWVDNILAPDGRYPSMPPDIPIERKIYSIPREALIRFNYSDGVYVESSSGDVELIYKDTPDIHRGNYSYYIAHGDFSLYFVIKDYY